MKLLDLSYDSLESFGVVNSKVSEHLTVNLYTSLVQKPHQLRIAQALHTSGSVNTLYPQSTEVTLLVATIAESVSKALLPSVFCNSPNILTGTKVTSGKAQDFLSLRS